MVDMSVGILNEAKVQDFGALLRQQEKGSAAASAEAERRQQNKALWLEHYLALSETYRRRAAYYAYKAERLCGDTSA